MLYNNNKLYHVDIQNNVHIWIHGGGNTDDTCTCNNKLIVKYYCNCNY